MPRVYDWRFPLPRTHTGVLMGNGTLGLMVWGEGNVLRMTMGRADLWDHRGGQAWTERQSYAAIRKCLETRDEPGIRALFEDQTRPAGVPRRPSVVPVGRLDLDFGPRAGLESAALDIDAGLLSVVLRAGSDRREARLVVDPEKPVWVIELPSGLAAPEIRHVPAWEFVKAHLKQIGFRPPDEFSIPRGGGWTQTMPADPGVTVMYATERGRIAVAVARPDRVGADARHEAERLLASAGGFDAVRRRAAAWWREYWRTVPSISVPTGQLQFLYEYGMYKFATPTNPAGVPATLQGPWIEEYRMPPWSSDYHFNINVQMCYSPAYHGNRLENLLPLFDMIESWKPTLRHNARVFLGIEDGCMLPHAVDDRCVCMGGFWTGNIDHGCTAWVAAMMYRYWRYTMDRRFLRERAFPFMAAAMRVYEEMIEERDGRFTLPVSVSPEYRGSRLDAWGANASFQLACVHMLARMLIEAARTLKIEPRPIWRELLERLPKACLIGEKGSERIALWEGTDLEESHRHHSHLAGIAPFGTLDPDDPEWKDIIRRSIRHWIYRGPGLWSGWCIPWASTINTRLGNAEMAEEWLLLWQRVFTNIGHGTLHDADVAGLSLMGIGATNDERQPPDQEIMQMDAGMGAVNAIMEMLLFERNGVNYVFRGAPREWHEASFGPMRTDGAFLVSGELSGGRPRRVTVKSLAGGLFRLANPWARQARVRIGRGPWRTVSGSVLSVATRKDDIAVFEPQPV